MTTNEASAAALLSGRGGRSTRLRRSLVGLTLGLAFPTFVVGRVLSISRINTALNRRVWCSDATRVTRVEVLERSGKGVGSSASLDCVRDGVALRTIGGGRLFLTGWVAAFLVSLVLLLVLVAILKLYAVARRTSSASIG